VNPAAVIDNEEVDTSSFDRGLHLNESRSSEIPADSVLGIREKSRNDVLQVILSDTNGREIFGKVGSECDVVYQTLHFTRLEHSSDGIVKIDGHQTLTHGTSLPGIQKWASIVMG